jgi:hypothetical protein
MLTRAWKYLLPLLLVPPALYPVDVLEVRAVRSDQILLARRVRGGESFRFSYVHSVEKIPVQGSFVVTERGGLRPLETRFPSFGPGLPFAAGEVLREGREMTASDLGPELDRLSFLVSPSTSQTLSFKDSRVSFAGLTEGERVTVQVSPYPLWRILVRHES